MEDDDIRKLREEERAARMKAEWQPHPQFNPAPIESEFAIKRRCFTQHSGQ